MDFEPVEITIKLDTLEEALDLWHRLNVAHHTFYSNSFKYINTDRRTTRIPKVNGMFFKKVWNKLDNHLARYDEQTKRRTFKIQNS
jgi:hypothetical protein